MDQQTTNRIEIVKAITISILTIGSVLALVLLAAFRDGVYSNIVSQQLPLIIGGGLVVLGAAVVTGGVVSIFQTKYNQQANTQVQTTQATTQAQTAIAQAQAQNGTAPAAPAPAAPAPTEPSVG